MTDGQINKTFEVECQLVLIGLVIGFVPEGQVLQILVEVVLVWGANRGFVPP